LDADAKQFKHHRENTDETYRRLQSEFARLRSHPTPTITKAIRQALDLASPGEVSYSYMNLCLPETKYHSSQSVFTGNMRSLNFQDCVKIGQMKIGRI